jgi:hypothetical protein
LLAGFCAGRVGAPINAPASSSGDVQHADIQPARLGFPFLSPAASKGASSDLCEPISLQAYRPANCDRWPGFFSSLRDLPPGLTVGGIFCRAGKNNN